MYSLLILVQVWSFDEGKGTEANDSSKKGHTATTVGKVEWDTGKIGQAAKFAPGSYFEAQHSSVLDLGIFTITVWVKFLENTGGGEQNIVYKRVDKDRSTRNYTLKMWDGQIWAVFASRGE